MVKTKGIEATVKNWRDAQGRVPAAYKAGVEQASGVIEAAKAAEPLYATKVQEAITNQSRLKGLGKVTDADWKKAATEKGAVRIAAGMAAAEPDFRKGAQGNLAVIEGISIPPRAADGNTNIDNRLKPIALGLEKAKKEGRL